MTDHINMRAQKGISFAFAFSSTTCSQDPFTANGYLLFPHSPWGISNIVTKMQKWVWRRGVLGELLRNILFVAV